MFCGVINRLVQSGLLPGAVLKVGMVGAGGVSETLPRGLLRSNYSHNAGKMLSVFFPSHSLMSWGGRGGESPRNYSDTWPLGSPNAGAVRIQLSSIKPEISDLPKKSHKATPLFSVKKYSFHEKNVIYVYK